jgi:hypothetical protein
MITRVKERMDAGEDVPDCVFKTLILTQEQEKLNWEDMCMLAAGLILGGVGLYDLTPSISYIYSS